MSKQGPITSSSFSATETKFLLTYIKHLKSSPEANWDNIADELGYDKVASARCYFREMKARHGLGSDSESTSAGARAETQNSPPSGRKKRRAPQQLERAMSPKKLGTGGRVKNEDD